MAFTPVIVIQGGAGTHSLILHDKIVRESIEDGVKESASCGYKILKSGGSALDAVQAAVKYMEDNPTFNAGKGSCLTVTEDIEMDASIMDGSTLKAGGVICIKNVANPIDVARLVMDKTDHCLFAGSSAGDFAESQGIPRVPTEDLMTEKSKNRLKNCKVFMQSTKSEFNEKVLPEGLKVQPKESGKKGNGDDHDTVGAIALDQNGNVAYATSTGGINAKIPGRCGDSPIIGSGGYAWNGVGATSTTGHGESLMKALVGIQTHNKMMAGEHPQKALEDCLAVMSDKIKGLGGAIALNMKGDIGIAFTTDGMSWASIKDNQIQYGIYKNECFVEKI